MGKSLKEISAISLSFLACRCRVGSSQPAQAGTDLLLQRQERNFEVKNFISKVSRIIAKVDLHNIIAVCCGFVVTYEYSQNSERLGIKERFYCHTFVCDLL